MRRAFVIVASLAILLILVRAAGFREVGDVWRSVRPTGIALSVACYYAALAMRILTWRRLLGPDSPPVHALFPPLSVGFVLGHVTPAKSGEPASAVLVSRSCSLPLSRTLSALTVERAVQLLVLLVTFVPSVALSAGGALELRGTVVLAAGLLALLLLALATAAPLLRRLAGRVRAVRRGGAAVARYLDAVVELLAHRRSSGPLLLLSIVFWILQYVSLWAILDAGGASVNLIDAAVVAGAAILGGTLTLLPLGTQDGISALVLAGLGIPLARGFALALFHSLLSVACGLALMLLALFTAGRRARGEGPPERGGPGPGEV